MVCVTQFNSLPDLRQKQKVATYFKFIDENILNSNNRPEKTQGQAISI